MTLALDRIDRTDRIEITRWSASVILALTLHGALLLALWLHPMAIAPIGTPPVEAVMMDLEPPPLPAMLPPLPLAEPPPVPPAREPEPPVLPPEPELPAIEPTPALHPAVVLPPSPVVKPKPKPVERTRPQPERTAPQPAEAPPAAPAAPAPATSAPATVQITWQSQLLAWLERHKRYPRVAQEQRQQGVVYLRFALDRQGQVLSFRIDKSSGYELLDEEVLQLIQRAQPLPAPPAEIGGARIDIRLPVVFSLTNSRR